ncbi:hypothetical protein [Puerhibacterium sp. TATVAM-FAB25]|uniref:hypothetical protein n=1 Tax=Puerhibacterium sp. TATVAM-FAB25 TaxID=3093699 RepID=UPI003978E9C3
MSTTADEPGAPRPQTGRPDVPQDGRETGAGTTPDSPPPPGTTEAGPEAGAQADADVSTVVDPTTVRRAPRYRAFFWLGALLGIVLGGAFGLYLVASTDPADIGGPLQKPGVYVTVIMLATTTVTVLLAGLVAVLLDRRSVRRR